MKKLSYLITIALILGLVLSGCSLLSNISQVPAIDQSGVTNLSKGVSLFVDLVGLWRFDGNTKDSSGNNNNGIVEGVETYDLMDRAFSFNGSTCVRVPGSDTLDVSQVTLEAWIKPNVCTQARYARIVYKGTNYFLAYDSDGRHMRMAVYIEGVKKYAVSKTELTDTNKWYHIVGTYDGNNVKIYIDYALEDTDAFGEIDSGLQDLGIGRNPGANLYGYKGLIDEVRIWNGALSPGQFDSVIYGFCDILPPIKVDGSRAFKLGSTVPVKFQLWDDNGEIVTNAEACIFVKKISNGTTGEIEAVSTAASTTGNLFRYDPDSEQYIFNLSTKLPLNGVSWSTGTWQIRIKLDDGTSKFVNIVLK
jgi:hypothetical protein